MQQLLWFESLVQIALQAAKGELRCQARDFAANKTRRVGVIEGSNQILDLYRHG